LKEDLKQILAEANAAFQSEDFESAEKLYLSVLEAEPDTATAHYALGTIALKRNDFEVALAGLAKALKLEPEAFDIAYNYAVCLAQTGHIKQALIVAQQATKYCKDDPLFCSRFAMLFHDLGEPQASIQLLLRLKALLPQDQIVLARANGQLNNWQESVDVLQRLAESLPEEASVAKELAVAAGRLRDYELAIGSYEKYLKLVRPSADDYLRFADLLLMAQNTERCNQAINLALDAGEDSAQIYILKANLARIEGDFKAANLALDEVFNRVPNDRKGWALRAELASGGDLADNITVLQAELDKTEQVEAPSHQHRAALHYALADMQSRLEQYDDAASSLRKANGIQHDLLRSQKVAYSEEQTENHISGIINDFSLATFDKPAARIENSATAKQPIFIVGMLRSGTTLVERILGQNKQVFCAGEQEAMEFVGADYNHLRMSGKISDAASVTATQWTDLRASYLKKLPSFSQAIFTDKLPHNFRQVGLILKLFPEARIIQMRRNIQDVCLSIYSRAFTPSHNYANRWEDLAHFYAQSEKLMNHWSSLNSPQILDVNYQTLVTNPAYVAKQLVEFCGFEWDESYLDFHETMHKSFTFSEKQVREPISDSRIDRWKLYQSGFPELLEL